MDLSINNVVSISVAAIPQGLSEFNTSNLALFTRDAPNLETFPVDNTGKPTYQIYLSPQQVATDFGTGTTTYAMALAVFSQQPNILANDGYLVIIPFQSGEILSNAIVRTAELVQYFGVMQAEIDSQTVTLQAAAQIQSMVGKMGFFVSDNILDIAPGGTLDLLRTGGYTQARGLFYGDDLSDDDLSALIMQASYAGRALSVDFQGSNTTQTMHLKTLIGVQPDPTMTETYLEQCQACGADVYISIQGNPYVFTSGANDFFDNQYNLQWFVGALQVAGFNALAQTGTKVPQTEQGVSVLKAAYRQVCQQAVTNQYAAPGTWNSPVTFGIQGDLIANIANRGYYIYSVPVSQQSASVRQTRAAPLIQIALQEAGAIHSTSVVVNIND